jgi:hypothetical protein
LASLDLPPLLGRLCDATDTLARLDAGAALAPAAVRDGLIARMAFAEAAGWLAHARSRVHPLDLALRDLGLTGTYALAVSGSARRVLPQTLTDIRGRSAWEDQSLDELADADRAVAEALALARLLPRIAARRTAPFTAAEAEALLAPSGAGRLDPARFARWARRSLAAPGAATRTVEREGAA